MANWLNPDGLNVKFGPEEGFSPSQAGQALQFGNEQSVEITLNLSELTELETIQSDVAIIPAKSMITKIEIWTHVAAATGTAIDLGTIHISRNLTDSEFTADPNGLLAAFVAASMSEVGEYTLMTAVSGSAVPAGTTTMGTQVGEITTAPLLFTASATTATAFTAGRISIKVTYLPEALAGFYAA